jgi:hypothetical protein
MALSAEDQQLIASMRRREFSIKKRQRATNAIFFESRRYRRLLAVLVTLLVAGVATGIFIAAESIHGNWVPPWRAPALLVVISVVVGPLLAQNLLRTRPGQRALDKNGLRLNRKYIGDLHAARRWAQFYYRGEDISCYVPQILYVIESEHRFDSVQAALEFVKGHQHENAQAKAHVLQQFNAVAAQADLVVLSSVNADGQPSSRLMRFVKTSRPGVWYVATAPNAPKVPELDGGKVAVITVPAKDGATISSNHVRSRRAGKTFTDVADLYADQAPSYLDGMTEEDMRAELVYELTLRSAVIEGWDSRNLVHLQDLNESGEGGPVDREGVVPQQQRREAHLPGGQHRRR